MRVHSLNAQNAKAIKSQLGLYKKRERLDTDKRKTKPRNYQRRMWPLCMKVVVRLENQ